MNQELYVPFCGRTKNDEDETHGKSKLVTTRHDRPQKATASRLAIPGEHLA